MISITRLVLLSRQPASLPHVELQSNQTFVELRATDAERISRTEQGYGRRGDITRIRRRFERGLRYFGIEEQGSLVAWQWTVHGVPRYLDELCWEIPLNLQQAWLRDVFVAPTHRGRRMMAVLFAKAGALVGDPVSYFSDVDVSNRASLRAHRHLGFEPFARVLAVQIGARFVLRSMPPSTLPHPGAISPERRLLRLSDAEHEWHRQRIA
jgi:hypothetical protein